MPDYYARRTGGTVPEEFSGPYRTYAKALNQHVEFMNRNAIPEHQMPQLHVLLDLSTVINTDNLAAALRDDPVLNAVFELGRRRGQYDES